MINDEKPKKKFRPKTADFILAAVITAAAALIICLPQASGSGGLTAVISQNGEELRRVDMAGLDAPVTLEVGGEYLNVITVERTRVCISSSTCPNLDCMRTGWISRAGQSIVCLPNRLAVRLEGSGGVDAVVG